MREMNRSIVLVGSLGVLLLMLGTAAGAGIGNTPFAVYLTEPALHPAPQAFTVGTGDNIGSFNIPVAPQYVSYLQEKLKGLSPRETITATFSIPSSAAFSGNPDGHNAAMNDVRIFFKSQLPEGFNTNSVIPGLNEYTYWWSNPVGYHFGDTTVGTKGVSGDSVTISVSGGMITVILVVTVAPEFWSDIYGHYGNLNASTEYGFGQALAGVTNIGLSFGSGDFFANGVGAADSGVIFTLNTFTVS